MEKTYTIRVRAAGNREPSLFEGSYDLCVNLAHSLEGFPADTMSVEIWDTDTCKTCYRWVSPQWN
jgi:hypothetical protein